MTTKKTYPYQLPVLHDYDGDLTKRWYIEWKAWNIRENKLERHRYWNLNRGKTQAIRYEKANGIMQEVASLLKAGMVYDPEAKPDTDSANENTKYMKSGVDITPYSPVLKAMRNFMVIKKEDCSDIYQSLLKTIYNRLREYLILHNKENITLKGLSTALLDDYLRWMKEKYKLDNNTMTNSKIIMLKSFVNYYYKKLDIPGNPVTNLTKFKTKEPVTDIYTDSEAKRIFSYTKDYFPIVYLLINFIYYACIRPKEMQLMQIKNIQRDHIIVPGRVQVNGKWIQLSKNSKTQLVRIFPGLEKVIQAFNLRSYPPEYFIFSKKGLPGKFPLSRGYFRTKYEPIVERFDLPPGKRVYNWKHTGAVKIYQQTKDIKFVQRHLRHASVQTTEMYLRKLMLLDDEYKEIDIDIFQ